MADDAPPVTRAVEEVETAADVKSADGDAPAAIKEDTASNTAAAGDAEKSTDVVVDTVVDSGDNKDESNGDNKDTKDDATEQEPAPAVAEKIAPSSTTKKATPKPSRRKSLANMKKNVPAKGSDAKYEPGDYVMAKMRSFPPWPAIVLNKDLLPPVMLSGPTAGKAKTLETLGSAAWETQYPIFYMGTYEYSWIAVSDLDPMTKEKIDAGAGSRKGKKLVEAFQEAAQGFTLKDIQDIQVGAMEVDEEVAEEPEDDGMDLDDEEAISEEEKPKKKAVRGKKRKKSDSVSDDEGDVENPPKTPKKAASKAKPPKSVAKATPAKSPKTPANGAKATAVAKKEKATPATSTKAKKVAPAKGKKGATKSKDTVGSDSEESDKSESNTLRDPAESTKEQQSKMMLHRRHRLQKAFLNKDKTPPKAEEMPELSKFLTSLESWKDLPADIIKSSKIHKVLRGITKVDFIPLDEKYDFKKRTEALLARCMVILRGSAAEPKAVLENEDNDPTSKENGVKDAPIAVTSTNGDSIAKEDAVAVNEAKEVKETEAEADSGAIVEATEDGSKTAEPVEDLAMKDAAPAKKETVTEAGIEA